MSEGRDNDLLIGRNPVIEALKSDAEIEKIYIAKGGTGSVEVIRQLAKDRGVRVDYVDRARLDKLTEGLKHQGVAAVVSGFTYQELDDVFATAAASGEAPFVVILDEIEDPHNLGAVIRTAECAGAHGVIIPKRRACGLTGAVAKAAAGALATMPVVRVTNLTRALDELKERGLWIAACDMDGETYYKADLSGPIGIVVGNEGSGISRLVREHCDFVVSIPLMGSINSLNASNAAAVIMYEVRRRRSGM